MKTFPWGTGENYRCYVHRGLGGGGGGGGGGGDGSTRMEGGYLLDILRVYE